MYQDGIVVLDFGGLDGRALARRMRGEQVFCTVLPIDAPVEQILRRQPRGLIIAGDSKDAFSADAPRIPQAVHRLGLPMLGIGYGARIMLRAAGGRLKSTEFAVPASDVVFDDVPLFKGLTQSDRTFDRLDDIELPLGFTKTAATGDGRSVAFECPEKKVWGMQFCPEANDPDGLRILRNFARGICGAEPNWNMEAFLDWSMDDIRAKVGVHRAMIAISGGVDSSVCAALIHRAVGDSLTCMHVDTGLMREGEREMVQRHFDEQGIVLQVIQAQPRFLKALSGLTESAQKREAMYRTYEGVVRDAKASMGEGDLSAQGTIYNDVLDEPETWAHRPDGMLEPLRYLFKDEVRELGRLLGLPPELVNRQAFPGPGLALRVVGEATAERIAVVRKADKVLHDEVHSAGVDKKVRQYFAVLTDTRTKGQNGYGYTVALRAVNPGATGAAMVYRMPYDLLERVCERIVTEVPCVNRVVYDITSKPPAMIEWE